MQLTDAVAKQVPQSPTDSTVMLDKAILMTGNSHAHIFWYYNNKHIHYYNIKCD